MDNTAFEEWLASQGSFDSPEEAVTVARAAWDAATERAKKLAAETAKRYTCKTMRGICHGIADRIGGNQ